MLCKGIQELVGVPVIALPNVAHHSGERRKQNQEVQILAARRHVHVDGAVNLRSQHRVHLLLCLLENERIAIHTGTMNHSMDFRESRFRLADSHSHVFQFGNIGLKRQDLGSVGCQLI